MPGFLTGMMTKLRKTVSNQGVKPWVKKSRHTTVEMAMVSPSFRVCLNIKSRANPDIQCPLSATHGEYCSRHYKNPRPFHKPSNKEFTTYSRSDKKAIDKIQKFWRITYPLYKFRHQGPAANDTSLAMNHTELYSLDPITTVTKHYLITFSDENKSIWAFDIRTIVQTMANGFKSTNPYTRTDFTVRAKEQIHRRIAWLNKRHYPVVHINSDILTEEQCWNHMVLDVFLKIDALGYYASCEWYHELNLYQHIRFYRHLFLLWEFRLGLTRADKERVVPTHATLFRFHPDEPPTKTIQWWRRNTLSLIEAFITRSSEKEQQKLGAMYILMALTRVSYKAAEAWPWLVEGPL